MDVHEAIADRRIREAREAGLFDNLPGRGRPIADLGRERPAGWWATRLITEERAKLRGDRYVGSSDPAVPRPV